VVLRVDGYFISMTSLLQQGETARVKNAVGSGWRHLIG